MISWPPPGVGRWLWWLLIAPGIPFVLISAGILIYANAPGDSGLEQPPPLPPETRSLTLVTHGKADDAAGWVRDAVRLLPADPATGEQVRAIDWSRGASDLFRCSRNAELAGRELAESVAAQAPALRRIEIVAHSAGAFLAYGFCREMRQLRPETEINITYLDPAGVYRSLLWDYGYTHFGRCANAATTLFHVGDGVPGSEAAPEHGFARDISSLRAENDPDGHLWPVRYFLQRLQQSPGPQHVPLHEWLRPPPLPESGLP